MIFRNNILLLALLFTACKMAEYDSLTVSIAELKSMYGGGPLRIEKALSIEGVIVANDESGNFYRTIVVQDNTGAIEIKCNSTGLYRKYRRGYRLTVHCNSLTLGAYGDLLQLGSAGTGSYQTDFIPLGQISAVLIPGDSVGLPAPLMLTLDALRSSLTGCFVRFDNVQFTETGLNWSDHGADTDRRIVDAAGRELIVRTSFRSAFAYQPLPAGSGSISGILSYFNGAYQLKIADIDDVNMNAERFALPDSGE
jgi:hypothetical protein